MGKGGNSSDTGSSSQESSSNNGGSSGNGSSDNGNSGSNGNGGSSSSGGNGSSGNLAWLVNIFVIIILGYVGFRLYKHFKHNSKGGGDMMGGGGGGGGGNLSGKLAKSNNPRAKAAGIGLKLFESLDGKKK
jgi:hypothetical protein